MKKRLASLTDNQKKEESAGIQSVLRAAQFWPSLSGLAAFLPLPDEPDLRPLLERSLAGGKTLFLPRIDGEDLAFHKVDSLEKGLIRHSYGMPEPSPGLPPADWTAGPILFLVPGLAFDHRGGRLGSGKGYYDRFFRSFDFSRSASVRIIGAAYSCQIAESLPIGETDFPIDGLVTAEGLFLTQGP